MATRTSLLVCCFFSLLILFFEIVYFDLTSDSILVNLLFELIGVRERTHNNQPTRHHIAIRHNHILLQYIFELFAVVGFLFVTLQSRNLLCLKFVCQKSDTKKTKWWKSFVFFLYHGPIFHCIHTKWIDCQYLNSFVFKSNRLACFSFWCTKKKDL